MKDKLVAMAIENIEDVPVLLYGIPAPEKEPNPLLITSIFLGAIAIIIGIVVTIKKNLKNKKDDENGKDVKK